MIELARDEPLVAAVIYRDELIELMLEAGDVRSGGGFGWAGRFGCDADTARAARHVPIGKGLSGNPEPPAFKDRGGEASCLRLGRGNARLRRGGSPAIAVLAVPAGAARRQLPCLGRSPDHRP